MLVMAKKRRKLTTLREKLKALREDRGLSIAQAADLAGVSFRAWTSWEYGERQPSKSTARLLIQIFPELDN